MRMLIWINLWSIYLMIFNSNITDCVLFFIYFEFAEWERGIERWLRDGDLLPLLFAPSVSMHSTYIRCCCHRLPHTHTIRFRWVWMAILVWFMINGHYFVSSVIYTHVVRIYDFSVMSIYVMRAFCCVYI